MAKSSDRYRLWQHEVKPPKPPERTVIAKVRPASGTTRAAKAAATAGGRAAQSVGVSADSGLANLLLKDAILEYQNFIGGSNKDFVGHGSHVSGIIAATGNNGFGISGVSSARILALKALPRDGED